MLPIKHLLRSYGQSKKCCPEGYFTDKTVLQQSLLEAKGWADDGERPEIRWPQSAKEVREVNPCDHNSSAEIQSFLLSNTDPGVWYHEAPYYPERLREYLFYHHCDYRPFHPYKRVTDSEYRSYGHIAIAQGSPYRGSKGVWKFEHLPYAKVDENVIYDPFHTLMNISTYTLKLLLSKRPTNTSCIQYCKTTHCHPSLWFGKTTLETAKGSSGDKKGSNGGAKSKGKGKNNKVSVPPSPPPSPTSGKKTLKESTPWVLASNEVINTIEEGLAAVYLPIGYQQDYTVKQFLTKLSVHFGVQKINFVVCAMDYFTFCISYADDNYAKPYLLYLSMLSSLVTAILSPVVHSSTIEVLYYKAVEFVVHQNGMFPPSESVHVIHQIIHLPPYIAKCGPVKNYWTLPSERAMGAIKSNVIKGGKNFEAAACKKEFAQELAKATSFYSIDDLTLHSEYIRKDPTSLNGFVYSDFIFRLRNKRNAQLDLEFTPFEMNNLLEFLVEELSNVHNSDDKSYLLHSSTLYRIHKSFSLHQSLLQDEEKQIPNFYQFACNLDHFKKYPQLQLDELPAVEDIVVNLQEGLRFVASDYAAMKSILNKLRQPINVYRSALLWGVRFEARGAMYREFEIEKENQQQRRYGAQAIVYEPSNAKNFLQREYNTDPVQYGSWCKVYTMQSTPQCNTTTTPQCSLGQLNCFMRLILPEEKLINGLCLASITMRKAEFVKRNARFDYSPNYYENLLQVDCDDNKSMRFDQPFVALYNIYPTPLAMSAWTISNTIHKAIKKYDNRYERNATQQELPTKLLFYVLERQKESLFSIENLQIFHPYHSNEPLYGKLAWTEGLETVSLAMHLITRKLS